MKPQPQDAANHDEHSAAEQKDGSHAGNTTAKISGENMSSENATPPRVETENCKPRANSRVEDVLVCNFTGLRRQNDSLSNEPCWRALPGLRASKLEPPHLNPASGLACRRADCSFTTSRHSALNEASPTDLSICRARETGDVLLSHTLEMHYHRGCSVSLPCSEWERVGPLRYDHQKDDLTRDGVRWLGFLPFLSLLF